jgi:hypothetical protein
VFNKLIENNYMYVVFWLWLSDSGQVFPTHLELSVFLILFFHISLQLATSKAID